MRHLRCINPCNSWQNHLPTGAGFLWPTVVQGFSFNYKKRNLTYRYQKWWFFKIVSPFKYGVILGVQAFVIGMFASKLHAPRQQVWCMDSEAQRSGRSWCIPDTSLKFNMLRGFTWNFSACKKGDFVFFGKHHLQVCMVNFWGCEQSLEKRCCF